MEGFKLGFYDLFDKLDEVLDQAIFRSELPLIGTSLIDAADFLDQIRDTVFDNLSTYEAVLTPDLVKQGIYDAVGPGGLGWLQDDPDPSNPDTKVNFEDDPAYYEKISEKLEAIIQKHKDNWDELCAELFSLRTEVQEGRKDDIEGVDPKAAPFYDLMGNLAFGSGGFPHDQVEAGRQLVSDVMAELEKTIDIINFWGNMPEVSKLRGRLTDKMLFSGIDEMADNADQIVTDITALAKRRHEDIVG